MSVPLNAAPVKSSARLHSFRARLISGHPTNTAVQSRSDPLQAAGLRSLRSPTSAHSLLPRTTSAPSSSSVRAATSWGSAWRLLWPSALHVPLGGFNWTLIPRTPRAQRMEQTSYANEGGGRLMQEYFSWLVARVGALSQLIFGMPLL